MSFIAFHTLKSKMWFIVLLLGFSSRSQACLDCPMEDRGKLRYEPNQEDNFLKSIAFANPNLFGGKLQQNYAVNLHPKQLAQRISIPSVSSEPLLPPPTKSLSASPNLFHLYTLLNKGPLLQTEPRTLVEDYLAADPPIPRISKKAEKGMMIDVMDYLQKSDDRNRRVGQNMRSSG